MKSAILFLVLVIFYSQCTAQKKTLPLICGELDILDVKPAVKGLAACSHCDITINALNKEFSIVLSDTSYEVIGLQIVYTNNKKEVTVKDISGNIVSPKNIEFLKNIEVGNFIAIECINIKRASELALSTSMLIYVTK